MGRRSRKRAAGAVTTRAERDAARTRDQRDAARRQRPPGRRSTDERPPAPWGKFPLVELLVLAGIVLMIWGALSWNETGNRRFIAGLALASLGGLELSVREHFAGYRSHTTLLSGVAAFLVISVLVLAAGFYLWILLAVGVVTFVSAFVSLRRVFQQRSGGLSFR